MSLLKLIEISSSLPFENNECYLSLTEQEFDDIKEEVNAISLATSFISDVEAKREFIFSVNGITFMCSHIKQKK